jgi:hypothetical protein
MTYKIQHKILTLARNAVIIDGKVTAFCVEDISFSHWDFEYREGWAGDAWLAESYVEAPNFHEACHIFRLKLGRIIPRVSLIIQCYIEFLNEPFLIHKENSDVAFLRYTKERGSVGLMFMEREKKALDILLIDTKVPDAFYRYWNDAVNTTGYSSKLLLMFSAIEALVKKDGKKDWQKIELILGKELTVDLFGTKKNPDTGLRHRLVHGEYFDSADSTKNYLDLVHKKIIHYFNGSIFSEKILNEDVVNPQRHFFGNKEECKSFVKSVDNIHNLTLKDIVKDLDDNDIRFSSISFLSLSSILLLTHDSTSRFSVSVPCWSRCLANTLMLMSWYFLDCLSS